MRRILFLSHYYAHDFSKRVGGAFQRMRMLLDAAAVASDALDILFFIEPSTLEMRDPESVAASHDPKRTATIGDSAYEKRIPNYDRRNVVARMVESLRCFNMKRRDLLVACAGDPSFPAFRAPPTQCPSA